MRGLGSRSGIRQATLLTAFALVVGAAPTLGSSRTLAEAKAPGQGESLDTVTPEGFEDLSWLPDSGRQCITKGPYRGFCQGPRRTPAPHGQAAELASQLGLGTEEAAHKLLHKRVPLAWRKAAPRPAARRLRWPVPEGRLVRGAGRVRRGALRNKPHNGFDIAATPGTPIHAAQSGLVAYSDNGVHGFGNLLILVHRDGRTTFYAHCEATLVFPGQQVSRGQMVALLGATGIARGPHLHFEYRKNGRPLDPRWHFAKLPSQARRKLREERTWLKQRRGDSRKKRRRARKLR